MEHEQKKGERHSKRSTEERLKSAGNSNTQPIKKENTYKVYWKDQEVGEYYGPGTPRQFSSFNETLLGSPDVRFVDAGIAKPKHLKELRLINGLSNRCGCWESSLTKKSIHKTCSKCPSGNNST